MSRPNRHHHKGNANTGRIIIVIAGIVVLAVNAFAFSKAASLGADAEKLKIGLVASTAWIICGAVGICFRSQPGRILVLTILYLGCLAFFVGGVMVLANSQGAIGDRMEFCVAGTIVYLIASLVVTHSRDVLRLTLRAWE